MLSERSEPLLQAIAMQHPERSSLLVPPRHHVQGRILYHLSPPKEGTLPHRALPQACHPVLHLPPPAIVHLSRRAF